MRALTKTIAKDDNVVKTTARVTLDFLFSLGQDELHHHLVAGVPDQVFTALGESFGRNDLTELPDESKTYSGLAPHIYLYERVKTEDAIVSSSRGLWLLAKELYTNPAYDEADLDAWAEDGFPFALQRVSQQFLMKRIKVAGVIPLAHKQNQLALASFRRLHA
jgi:hypothetical protein